ncbi:hypothetical protein [Cryptosporangium aurantiacum]|uniref:Uncharacterized protein n=1 Tax=Cryptosporangium aurantiacum TaxID=134849 RepID=A0A1M7RNG6_9ACTN|nr:hypothetical protein [Cryptosporangium aurantiacum]SHN47751.1 hypothetical protein SAMN05443668_12754 [Cryptosporangium aurantiacum]
MNDSVNYGVSSSGSGDVSITNSVLGRDNTVVRPVDTRIDELAVEIRAALQRNRERLDQTDDLLADLETALAELHRAEPDGRRVRTLLQRIGAALGAAGVVASPVADLVTVASTITGGTG